MQFVTNGPDIPDALMHAHEDGRVVFFCGAGISYPAGLSGFKGLVDDIYRLSGTAPSDIERAALARTQFDAALDLLERRLPGQRLAVRRALAQALTPKLRRKGSTDTHAALLRLARNREGVLRLVTTNFDRVFHSAGKRTRQTFQAHAAPMLPIPKNSRWNGLVYLHGLLPEKGDDTALNRLVLTSGDFGLAYLTERWAARFVSELFRNYVVCFVGYSINDPVLRYMMDALAADRMLGEVTPQAWALGDCEPGQEVGKTIEWKAKGVTPILYQVDAGGRDHSRLHLTLHAWADTYRDGVTGKERIVVAHALARPSASTRQDDFVGRMLWALSDPSGLPARRFAEFNPVPSLDWLLGAIALDRYEHHDLSRFGVPPRAETDAKLRFSLIQRPAPYPLAPPMRLVTWGNPHSQLDEVMWQLGRWLVRHINDPRLVLWVAERGGHLHERWIYLIEDALDRLAQPEGDSKAHEFGGHSTPNAAPGPHMRTLWRLLLSGRVKSPWREPSLYRWKSRLKREGLTATLRLELRELLSPRVSLRKPFQWEAESENADELARLQQVVDWDLVLTTDHVQSTLHDLGDEHWKSALPSLLEDLQQLLRDALALMGELGTANDRSDRSYWDLPSIAPHWQNRGFRDWVVLIEMLRDAWLAVLRADRVRAARIATEWFGLPYPTFKRLALFAASQDRCIDPELWVEWLLADGAWWLWASDTRREVMRLFVLQGRRLTNPSLDRIELAILAGPVREMYRDDLAPDQWQDLVESQVWLRLAKLGASGLALGASGTARLGELSRLHPQWHLASSERDEFSHWMSGTGDPDHEERREVAIAPRKRGELVRWLVKPQLERGPLYEDSWRDVCRTRFFHSLFALCDLAKQLSWPAGRWQEALQVWSEDGLVSRSWRYAAPLVQTMPDAVLREVAHGVTWWLAAASNASERHEGILLDLCRRFLSPSPEGDSGITRNDTEPSKRPVEEAINHPIGHVTQALINCWSRRNPGDGDLLPAHIAAMFTQMCNTRCHRLRHGRALLASRLIALFRVDRSWTEKYLLPLFDWKIDSMEAKAAWEGFLWSPRLYEPLLVALKPHFLVTSKHYDELGDSGRQFSAFLTYAALEPLNTYTMEDWRVALGQLPQKGLEESAEALVQALGGAAEQREEYWKNRILPFWLSVWPKTLEHATPGVAEALARLCIAAGTEFPAALASVIDWLRPIEHPYDVIHSLHESGNCEKFPDSALLLLAKIVDRGIWSSPELAHCLDQMQSAAPGLSQDPRFQRIRDWVRMQRG